MNETPKMAKTGKILPTTGAKLHPSGGEQEKRLFAQKLALSPTRISPFWRFETPGFRGFGSEDLRIRVFLRYLFGSYGK